MSIEHPPHDKQARPDQLPIAECADESQQLHRDNAQLQASQPPCSDDGFVAALSPMLEEVGGLQDEPRHETNDVLLLLEENARLRKLAVKLSNLLGDLPQR